MRAQDKNWHECVSAELLADGGSAKHSGVDVALHPAASRRFSAFPRLPSVAVVHDLARLHVSEKHDAPRMFYFESVLLGRLRRAAELVAISSATRDDLAEAIGVAPTRIRIVTLAADIERFSPLAEGDPRVSKVIADLDLARPYLLFAARLEHPGKNRGRLLQAFAASNLRDRHLRALAGADWGAAELITAEAQRLGIGERVRFLGYVADEALPVLIAAADVIVMVGLREGFGLPALEGLACGRPIVASNTGSLPEVVGPFAAPCDPLDVSSIREALERAAGDRELRDRTAREGPRWAAARGWDTTVAGLLEACRTASERA